MKSTIITWNLIVAVVCGVMLTTEGTCLVHAESIEQEQGLFEGKMKEIDKNLDALEEKAKSARDEVKVGIKKEMVELRRKQKEMHDKVQEMKKSSGKAWVEVKKGAEAALNDLEKSYKKAMRHFK